MVKKILVVIILLSLVGAMGCSITSKKTDTSSPASVRTVREAKIGSDWAVKQLQVDLPSEFSIVLKLASGDKVDGYFYLEKGNNVGFTITGKSSIYESKSTDGGNKNVSSDRFSFTASQDQGVAYTLTLNNSVNGESAGTTVFLEVIYPAAGSVFVPIGTK
jgi:hypothetical protein